MSASLSYKTVRTAAMAQYEVKRSRFLAHCQPVATQEEATSFLAQKKKEYWDATHNVSAYILREGAYKRYSDDGEPQGTAGLPALDVLEKQSLCDCIVVVTRYFGGIMLGAGGLVRAYSHAAALGVQAAGVVTMALCAVQRLQCDYAMYQKIAVVIPQAGGTIQNTDFREVVEVTYSVPQTKLSALENAITQASFGQCKSIFVRESYEATEDCA